jgi:hypothetical protein
MVDREAASVKIVDIPCISIARLLDLRAFIDSGLAFHSGEQIPKGEALMANQWTRTQRDLFDEPPTDPKLGATERAKVLRQVQLLIDARNQRRSEKRRQLELALQQARYEAARAQRQYDVADPENRLVAGELERRWNERLVAVRNLEAEIGRLDADKEPILTDAERERLMALGRDLVQAWESPGATSETRKKIIRTVISEIIVDIIGDSLGAHHPLARRGPHASHREEEPPRPNALDHRC